jgi:hypothetical protein
MKDQKPFHEKKIPHIFLNRESLEKNMDFSLRMLAVIRRTITDPWSLTWMIVM